ncbi:E3 ubiquitin-protein ligase PUB23 [Cannabis sativa]|uniref:E3 ubiquitin-protein ligase PUB23 n=1 Tax=Cannabis sativa TaxID=3483 RepID=UPI0029CA9646|nr:E3 ubiquitin-protein ligase PUB23 [Cannabis sativa]
MDEIEVPQFFICPISLEIMKDPVTLSTGITYDRESIEKWLFSGKNECCPVSKQPIIPDSDLTPNHTLRRLIQAWCTMNASHGIERIPTPKPPINKTQIIKLINDAKSPQSQIKCLRRLRSIAAESETNKRCLESAGAVDFLASLIGNNYNELENDMSFCDHFARASDEALCILNNLQLSETVLKNLMARNQELVESLTKVMQRGTCESRVHAVVLLKSLLEVADPMRIIGLRPELFVELVQVLKDQDQVSRAAFKAALQLLIQLCPWGRNRIKAVEAGAVPVLIELLLETNSSEKRRCVEVAMAVLDTLCGCAEGRAEFLHHSAGLAMVSKKILRVSQTASEKAVRILHSISKFSATSGVLQEMLQLGVVAKLCLVLQVDCGSKTKERAREILKLHARTWKKSPCVPTSLLSSYPA